MKFNRNDLMRTFTFILLLVICSLMLPPVPVLAADPDDIDWPDFSKLDGKVSGLDIPLEMPPFSFVGTNFSSWVARYKEIRADKSERRLVITISYWPDPSKMFENSVAKDTQAQLDANPGVIPIPEIYRDGEDFRIIELENPSSCEFAYLYYSRRTGYGGQRNFRYRENYNINVSGSGGSAWGSDARFKEAYDQAEQYAKNAVDGLVAGNKGILTLQYYDPILVTSKDGFKGCDIVATLKDKNGKGITGKEVYFFKDLRTGFKEVFRLPVAYGQTSALNINLPQAFDDVPGYVKTSVAVTNENGVARWNYLESLVIDWDPLINFKPASSDESLETRIIAVVFNKNPNKSYPAGEGPQIEYAADIPVAFKGVAAITSRNTADSSQKSVIKVGPPGGEKVVVTTLPYYLHAGEEVFIDSNTIVTIKWISGHAITANVKKDFKDGGTIYIDYKDAGWYRAFDQYVGGPIIEALISPAIAGVGVWLTAAGEEAAGALIAGAPVAIAIGLGIAGYEITKWQYDPLIVEPHSQILIGIDDGFSVYTVEGTAKLFNMAGESIEVSGGKTASVSIDGQFSAVSGFKESDLNDDLRMINEAMVANSGAPSGGSSGGLGSTGIIIGAMVAVVIIGGVFIGLRRKRRK